MQAIASDILSKKHHASRKKRKAESGKSDLITGWKVINKRRLGESWNELGVLDTEIPRLRLEEGMVGKRGNGVVGEESYCELWSYGRYGRGKDGVRLRRGLI